MNIRSLCATLVIDFSVLRPSMPAQAAEIVTLHVIKPLNRPTCRTARQTPGTQRIGRSRQYPYRVIACCC